MNHQAAFTQFFSELEDPRQTTKIAYPFFDVVFLTVCAAIGGAQGWEDIELFGEAHLEWFQRNGLFPNGLPVHDTIARIISRIQPEQFQNAFVRWMQATSERTDGRARLRNPAPCKDLRKVLIIPVRPLLLALDPRLETLFFCQQVQGYMPTHRKVFP